MKMLVLGDFQGKFSDKLLNKIKKEDFDFVIGVGDYGGIEEWREWVMQNLRDAKKGKPYLTAEEFFGKKKLKVLMKKDEEETKKVLIKLNSLGKPVIMVFGNGDDSWYDYPFGKTRIKADKRLVKFIKKLKNIKDITYSQTKYRNVNFVGFGGYMDIEAYLDGSVFPESKEYKKYLLRLERLKRSEKNLFSRLKKIKGEKIFVFHYPPMGAFDIIKDKKDNPMNGKSAGVRFFKKAIEKYKPKIAFCGHMHEYRGTKKIGKTIVVNPGDAEKDKYAIISYPDIKIKMSK